MTKHYDPLIVIGAARSGTKVIRDVIATHPKVDRIPYDINYVWRLGNENVPHDELSQELVTPRIRQKILRNIERYRSGAPFIVEKTVSNCLRVSFVLAVFPDAKLIHLVRDGRDVIESAYRQWNAAPDWRYILDKTRTFPLIEAFGYAFSYVGTMARKIIMRDKVKAGTWGPRYAGIDDDVVNKDLIEVCAIQWVRSVEKATADLARLPTECVHSIRYEEFVHDPRAHLEAVARFAGFDPKPYLDEHVGQAVSQGNVGKGLRSLRAEQLAIVLPMIQSTLAKLHYV